MPNNSYTIAMLADGQLRKITKLMFGRDGSYMVMMPYHSSNRGILFKAPVAYSPVLDKTSYIPFEDVLDAGDVDEKRVKLSHHRSGLLQFSGEGIISGFDDKGNPKGIGIQSWTLDNPAPGPSFGIAFQGLSDFRAATPKETQNSNCSDWIIFDVKEFPPTPGNGFVLEGFYFPPKGRRFLKCIGSKSSIQIVHPVGVVMDLKAAVADPAACDFPGFIGITIYPNETKFGAQPSGYIVSSSTGNVRRNEKGEIIGGDGLYCVFPDELTNLARRNLDYVQASSSKN